MFNERTKDGFAPISFFFKVSSLVILVGMKSNDALMKLFYFSSRQREQYTWIIYIKCALVYIFNR
jgi:hypothetical protein